MTDARSYRYRCARGDAGGGSSPRSPDSAQLGPPTPRAMVCRIWDQVATRAGVPRWRAFPRLEAEQALDRLMQHAAPVLDATLTAYLCPQPAEPARDQGPRAFCEVARADRGAAASDDPSPLGWAYFVARRGEPRR